MLRKLTLDELKELETNGMTLPPRLTALDTSHDSDAPTATVLDLGAALSGPERLGAQGSGCFDAIKLLASYANVNPLVLPAFIGESGDEKGDYAAALVHKLLHTAASRGLQSLHEADCYQVFSDSTEKLAEVVCSAQSFADAEGRILYLIEQQLSRQPLPTQFEYELSFNTSLDALKATCEAHAAMRTNKVFVHIVRLESAAPPSDVAVPPFNLDDMPPLRAVPSNMAAPILLSTAESSAAIPMPGPASRRMKKTRCAVLRDSSDDDGSQAGEGSDSSAPPDSDDSFAHELAEAATMQWDAAARVDARKALEHAQRQLDFAEHDFFQNVIGEAALEQARAEVQRLQEAYKKAAADANTGTGSTSDGDNQPSATLPLDLPTSPLLTPPTSAPASCQPRTLTVHHYVIAIWPGQAQHVLTGSYDSIGSLDSATSALWPAISAAPTVAAARQLLLQHAPNEFYLRGEAILRNKATQLAAARSLTTEPDWQPSDFCVPLIPRDILETTSVLLPGAAGIGKTCWAAAHFQHPFTISTLDMLQVVPPEADGLIFDDMNFGENGLGLTAEEMIALLDTKVSKNIKCRHYDGRVPLLPRIFTTNLDCSTRQHPFTSGASQAQTDAINRRHCELAWRAAWMFKKPKLAGPALLAANGARASSGAALLSLW